MSRPRFWRLRLWPSLHLALASGGKTASLKTLGLLALMPKAGLFIPADPAKPQGLEWFAEVLADVGDSQDLAQNLSTFSGHVHRLKRITAAASPSSLVLLDEVRPIAAVGDTLEATCAAYPPGHGLSTSHLTYHEFIMQSNLL